MITFQTSFGWILSDIKMMKAFLYVWIILEKFILSVYSHIRRMHFFSPMTLGIGEEYKDKCVKPESLGFDVSRLRTVQEGVC